MTVVSQKPFQKQPLMLKNNLENETEWIFKLKNGNKQAFEVIYQFYSNSIYSKIIKMTKDQAVADDLLQDIFVKIWERRSFIKEEFSFRGWIYKIAENCVYDYYRMVSQDAKMREKLIGTFAEMYNHTEDYILNKERSKMLNDALAQLPPQRQAIFKLCKIDGKSYAEAAEILNISASTVSGQLVKATRTIKDHIFFNSKEFLIFCITMYFKGR